MVDPPVTAREEAITLLHATAEVEHALMVQYLYAAYSVGSVPSGDPREGNVALIKYLLLHIAREEMAHLATVQNLLHLLGGPLHLDRQHSPFASQLLPFRFKLEPLSLGSLAKYVIAESPRPLPTDGSLTPAEIAELTGEVTVNAKASNDGICPTHVGDIFARLIWLFKTRGDADDGLRLQDSDFVASTEAMQADWQDVGYEPKQRTLGGVLVQAEKSLVRQFAGANAAQLRTDAVAALEAIAGQGEGVDPSPGNVESHFDWFRLLYMKFKEVESAGGMPVWNVPINPNTTPVPAERAAFFKMIDAGLEAALDAGRITNERSRRWAQLSNLRYRMLLVQLHHYLRINAERYTPNGDRTARGHLLRGLFREMGRIKLIAGKLVTLPKLTDAADPRRAGPPFELPPLTQLPDGETNRWRSHLDAARAAVWLVDAMLIDPADAADPFLQDVKAADEADLVWMSELAAGRPLPPQSQEFFKVVASLEEAVRGFTVGPPHFDFWAGVPRGNDPPADPLTGFVNLNVSNAPILARAAGGGFNPATSRLLLRLKGVGPGQPMPRERPPLPAARIQFIESWIAAGCPDNTPPYRGLVREREPVLTPPPPPPGVSGPSFATQIRPLFRPSDVSCMKAIAGYDLSVYADVKANAAAIFARLDDGSMPPDGRWPQADIDLFKAWMDAGFPQ